MYESTFVRKIRAFNVDVIDTSCRYLFDDRPKRVCRQNVLPVIRLHFLSERNYITSIKQVAIELLK